MKKIISIVILCAMLLSVLVSCGSPAETALNLENYPAAKENTAPVGFTGNKTVSTTEGEYDVWDGTTKDTAWWDNKAEGTTTFTLTTAEEFMGFLELRKGKEAFDGITIQLGIDIILNEVKDGKAGNVQSKSDLKTTVSAPAIPGNAGYFTGTFDGQNHVISGWYMTNNASNRSVFGAFGGGTLKNVAVVDSVFLAAERSSNSDVFGLISVVTGGQNFITNVYSDMAITTDYLTNTTYSKKYAKVGGLIGDIHGDGVEVAINNCEFAGTISGVQGNNVGGFVGFIAQGNKLTIQNSVNNADISGAAYLSGFVGGIDSYTKDGVTVNATLETLLIQNCVNNGSITGTGSSSGAYVGSISDKATVKTLTIQGCTNNGAISANGSVSGGLGYVNSSIPTLNIVDCVNKGTVTSKGNRAGGFIGYINQAIKNCKLENCVNDGDVSISQSKMEAAGLIGGFSVACGELNVISCINNGTISGDRLVAGLIGTMNNSTGVVNVLNSTNNGAINVTKTSAHKTHMAVGGLIGKIYGKDNITFDGCRNIGDITVVLKCTTASAGLHYYTYVGGLIGQVYNTLGKTGKTVTFKDCYSGGNIAVSKDSSITVDNLYFAGAYCGGFLNEYVDVVLDDNVNNSNVAAIFGSTDRTWFEMTGDHVADLTAGDDGSSVAAGSKKDIAPLGTDAAGKSLMIGVQQKENENGTFDLRYIAAISPSASATAAGFKVGLAANQADGTAYNYAEEVRYVANLYKSIKGTVGNDEVIYKAADYGAEYLMTVVVAGVPAAYVEDAKSFKAYLTPFEQANENSDPVYGQTTIQNEKTYLYANKENAVLWTGANMSATQYDFTGKDVITIAGGSYGKDNFGVHALSTASDTNGIAHYYIDGDSSYCPIAMEDCELTYTFNVETAGTYTLYLNLRLKLSSGATGDRYSYMMLDNQGYDLTNAYYIGYDSFAATDADGNYLYSSAEDAGTYVATGIQLNLTAGQHTLTFKCHGVDNTLHFRNLYLVK